MADYISTLTGIQMDSALIDMAEHTSEAYAVGERNGVPVDSSDVTYHNNARYYAQQAQSIAPASVTEAVRWDIAQTALSDANRLQARDNIKATSHNYNLLDNGWFLVNSRGQSSYSASAALYTADRWFISANGTLTINSGYISVTGQAGGVFGQYLNNFSVGTQYTASVKLSDGTINSVTFTANAGVENIYTLGSMNLEIDTRSTYAAHPRFMLYANSAWTVNLAAVKLELGSFSTLAEDTPPSYGEELVRCIYSKADPADTYANQPYPAFSNPNLLDNPFFTVNQRGWTSGTANNVYTVDRWKTSSHSSYTVAVNADGSLTIDALFYQKVSNKFRTGTVLTISYMKSDGTIVSKTGTITSSEGFAVGNNAFGFYYRPSTGVWDFQMQLSGETVVACKLELGSVSTLANDAPPDYPTELAKCKYYFKRFSPTAYTALWSGIAVNATTAAVFVDGEMRQVNPTVSISGTGYLAQSTSMKIITSGAAYYTKQGTRLLLVTSGTLTVNAPLDVYTSANQDFIVDISADL